MSDDSETVEDTEKGSLTEVTDDSCTLEFIEVVPFDRASDDFHSPGFVDPVAVISLEELQDVKVEPVDESISEDLNYFLKQELADECETDGSCLTTVHMLLLVFDSF